MIINLSKDSHIQNKNSLNFYCYQYILPTNIFHNSTMQLQQPIRSELISKFKVLKLLGKGAFGNVYECQDLSDWQRYALKVISKLNVKKSKIESLKEQAKLLQQLSHTNIVKIYECGQTDSCIFIKMEIALNGTLQQLVERKKRDGEVFSDDQIAKIMLQIFRGLAYIHSLNIIHRDIKPENILMTEGEHMDQVKIADFGLSTKLNFHYPKSAIAKCGTLLFMAPQILCKYTYTKAIDVWSTSIIMFILCNGKHPIWNDKMTTEEYSGIMGTTTDLPQIASSNKLAQNFFMRIAKVDPHERYSAQEGLKHPWMTRNFQDQIPLAVHQSYSSFNTAGEVVKLMKINIALRAMGGQNRPDIPSDYYSRLSYRSPSPVRQISATQSKLKKLKSLNLQKGLKIGDRLQLLDDGRAKPKFRLASESQCQNPAINKLNQIFNTLFDKKITSKQKLHFQGKKQNSIKESYQTPCLTEFKETIERQIQRSVYEVLQNSKNKNRRILPVQSKKPRVNVEVEGIRDEQGNKASFVRKMKIKKRNTTDQRIFGK